MKKLLLVLSVLSLVRLQAEEPAPARGIEAGVYLLVYHLGPNDDLLRLKVSFTKNADGSLAFACAKAAASPNSVFQHKTTFLFSVFTPGSWKDNAGGDAEALSFVGTPDLQAEPGVYEGTVASTTIGVLDGISQPATTGHFLLYKLNP